MLACIPSLDLSSLLNVHWSYLLARWAILAPSKVAPLAGPPVCGPRALVPEAMLAGSRAGLQEEARRLREEQRGLKRKLEKMQEICYRDMLQAPPRVEDKYELPCPAILLENSPPPRVHVWGLQASATKVVTILVERNFDIASVSTCAAKVSVAYIRVLLQPMFLK
jgi:hypothetical protein